VHNDPWHRKLLVCIWVLIALSIYISVFTQDAKRLRGAIINQSIIHISHQHWFIKSVHETGIMIAISPNADESEKDITYMYHDELWLKK
jgi:hypothetical protein